MGCPSLGPTAGPLFPLWSQQAGREGEGGDGVTRGFWQMALDQPGHRGLSTPGPPSRETNSKIGLQNLPLVWNWSEVLIGTEGNR